MKHFGHLVELAAGSFLAGVVLGRLFLAGALAKVKAEKDNLQLMLAEKLGNVKDYL